MNHWGRYDDPTIGVFNSLDPFEGIAQRPMSLNGYSWVEGNVPNVVDPMGLCPDDDELCNIIVEVTNQQFGVQILWGNQPLLDENTFGSFCLEFNTTLFGAGTDQMAEKKGWTREEVISIFQAFSIFNHALKRNAEISNYPWPTHNQPIRIVKIDAIPGFPRNDARTFSSIRTIAMSESVWSNRAEQHRAWLVLHEFGHVILDDQYAGDEFTKQRLSFADWTINPTEYSASSGGGVEFLVESMTGTIWNFGHNVINRFDEGADGWYRAM